MTLYEKYKNLDIDFALIGLAPQPAKSDYFCTPKGAKIIGWAGVDGIHYCFIKGFGEMVFAVSPMNEPGNYVHPLAQNFEDFLRLVLACGEAALEQAHQWSEDQFNDFLRSDGPSPAQKAVLAQLGSTLGLTPMEQPYGCIRTLQESFDHSAIPFRRDCPTAEPAKVPAFSRWTVYYSGNFWGKSGSERPGREVPIKKTFLWGDESWYIPAVYVCGKGLVMDICREIGTERMEAFIQKWAFCEYQEDRLTRKQRRQMEEENPMEFDFRAMITLNGRQLREKHCSRIGWIPDSRRPAETENSEETTALLAHYNLDPVKTWSVQRVCFPWATRTKPKIKTLSVTMEPPVINIPGPQFETPEIGSKLTFSHPLTGQIHTLTVEFRETAQSDRKQLDIFELPTHYTLMAYKLDPPLSGSRFVIRDTEESDEPRLTVTPDPESPRQTSAACIGIIGGADGPTALFFSRDPAPAPMAAHSALRFEPAKKIVWQMLFLERLFPNLTVELLQG